MKVTVNFNTNAYTAKELANHVDFLVKKFNRVRMLEREEIEIVESGVVMHCCDATYQTFAKMLTYTTDGSILIESGVREDELYSGATDYTEHGKTLHDQQLVESINFLLEQRSPGLALKSLLEKRFLSASMRDAELYRQKVATEFAVNYQFMAEE